MLFQVGADIHQEILPKERVLPHFNAIEKSEADVRLLSASPGATASAAKHRRENAPLFQCKDPY